jgi:hypothetical protein
MNLAVGCDQDTKQKWGCKATICFFDANLYVAIEQVRIYPSQGGELHEVGTGDYSCFESVKPLGVHIQLLLI